WAPQSTIAYQMSGNRNYSLVDPSTGRERALLKDETRGWAFFPVWSPDGKWIAIDCNRREGGGLWVVTPDDETERLVARGGFPPLGWSSDGQWIYGRSGNLSYPSTVLYRIPFAGGDPQPWLTLPIDDQLGECTMTPDARVIACTAGGDSDVWM